MTRALQHNIFNKKKVMESHSLDQFGSSKGIKNKKPRVQSNIFLGDLLLKDVCSLTISEPCHWFVSNSIQTKTINGVFQSMEEEALGLREVPR